jgi:hypothetical protein
MVLCRPTSGEIALKKFIMLMIVLFCSTAYAVEQSDKSITINQTWSKDGIYSTNGYVSTIAPVNGVITNSNQSVVDVSSLLNSQRMNFNGMADETIRNTFNTYANRFFDSISGNIVALVSSNNAQSATINFVQQFQQGTILKKVINSTLIRITGSGQVQTTRLGTAIIRDPVTLKATYISKAVSAEVPPEYAYPNAGMIVYQLFDKNNNPITGSMTVDVGGAYDQIDSSNVSPSNRLINTSWMPECLVARDWADYVHAQKGVTLDGVNAFKCPTAAQGATTDIKTLANQYDATNILLNYAQKLSVVYDQVDPTCTLNCQQTARIIVNVNSRVLTSKKYIFFIAPYGKPTYTVSGDIGYSLLSDTLQFYAKTDDVALLKDTSTNVISGAGAGLTILNNMTQLVSSPIKSFSKTIELANAASRSFYQNLIINPFSNTNPAIDLQLYDWRNDTLNGLAPTRYCYVGNCSQIAPITGGIN